MKKSRINDFLASVAEAKGVSESILIGGASKKSESSTINTINGDACVNASYDECNASTNRGNCKNAVYMCNDSSNGGNCNNGYKPAT